MTYTPENDTLPARTFLQVLQDIAKALFVAACVGTAALTAALALLMFLLWLIHQ